MALMAVCGALVVVAVVSVLRWGHLDVAEPRDAAQSGAGDDAPPPGSGDPDASTVARRFARSIVLAVVSGVGAGLLVAGAGGRLAMRLLAATAGDAAQGRLTEAEQRVGEITVGGTIGFVVFTALFFGAASGAVYMVLRRWLPPGRLGGAAYGLLLLLVAAPQIDPLRRDNPDFDIVGPGWLALAVFASLTVLHAMTVAAIAGRYSRSLPLLGDGKRAALAHAPLLLLAPMVLAVGPLLLVGIVVVVLSQVPPVVRAVRSPALVVVGRVVLAAVALAALPAFVRTAVDIAGRGPG